MINSRRKINKSLLDSSGLGPDKTTGPNSNTAKSFPVSYLFSSLAEENNVRSFNKSATKANQLPNH